MMAATLALCRRPVERAPVPSEFAESCRFLLAAAGGGPPLPAGRVVPLGAVDVLVRSETFRRANAAPSAVDIGSSVRVCLGYGRSVARMTEEGVVIEVVPGGCTVRASRVCQAPAVCSCVRFVVQCWEVRVVRRAAELAVVAL